ncbi:hypothetical protein C7H84_09485 [Burkholderia sp. Nafp2/4-1b]|nr:hypothetical protein C7H84_09485 [Burkholderia sp. Nafp2/4-1b]
MRRKLPAIYNEPMHLYQPRYTLTALREVELENLQVRIVRARHSNARIARALDWLRFGAVASPIMFVVLSVVWWVGSSACGARP